MDRLTPLLERFPPNVRIFYSGTLSDRYESDPKGGIGYIHWLKSGAVDVLMSGQPFGQLTGPGVIFCPGGVPHGLIPKPHAELISAEFEFGQRFKNPLTAIQPGVILIPVSGAPEIAQIHELLIGEAFSSRCGKAYGANQLLEYFVLVVFRHLIQTQAMPSGVTKALADERLLKAITSMHKEPAKAWTLEALADIAGMSRASFASHFKQATSATPMGYLTDWRISLAQSRIAQGATIKAAAREVGYTSPAALTRVFSRRVGCSPKDWQIRG
jgi:AraC-like DNA-binding protein